MRPELTLTLSGEYGFDGLEKMIQTLEPLLHLDEEHVIRVDLRRLVFLGPASLALLIAALSRASDLAFNAKGSAILPPRSLPTRRYLERMNLIREVAGEWPEDFTRRDPVGFRPCQHFTDDQDYFVVAKSLSDALRESLQVERTAGQAVRICLDEICENVVHHADAAHGGYAVAQGFPKRKPPQFEIAIVDLGVGIRHSLTQNPRWADIDDDADAIARALEPRVTATPERNAGIGLFVTTLLLAFNGGQLVVRSGTGSVARGTKRAVTRSPTSLPGTLVALRARMDRPLDVAPIYAAIEKLDAQAVAQADAGVQDDPDRVDP